MYKVFSNEKSITLLKNINKEELKPSDQVLNYLGKASLLFEINKFLKDEELKNLYVCCNEGIDIIFREITSMYQVLKAAGGIVKNDKSEFLFIFRRGKWDLPKGKKEPDENLKKTAIREVMEETGLKGLNITRKAGISYHTYELKNHQILKKTTWFEMSCRGRQRPKPQKEEDITAVKWLKKENISEVIENTYPSIIELLKKTDIYS